jgi:hypothetical protein
MVERVARTLCRADGRSENVIYHEQLMWRSYEETARMVVLAMREPSLRMLAVRGSDWKVAVVNWYAMIDAALEPVTLADGVTGASD